MKSLHWGNQSSLDKRMWIPHARQRAWLSDRECVVNLETSLALISEDRLKLTEQQVSPFSFEGYPSNN